MPSANLRPGIYRRQAVLFLAAILVPCLLLVALSIRMISQERELAEKRAGDERQRLAMQTGQELVNLLEKIKLEEMRALGGTPGTRPFGYRHPAVVFLGKLEGGRLVLPWEAGRFGALLEEGEFGRKIRQGERDEIIAKQPGKAAESYRQALLNGKNPSQSAYARMLLARALDKDGRHHEAQVQFRDLLRLPFELTDEHGIPFALYAASRLVQTGSSRQEVLRAVRAAAIGQRVHATPGAYILRDVVRALNLRELEAEAARMIRTLEQAANLRRDFPKLTLHAGDRQAVWFAYGEPAWLVSVASEVQPPSVMVLDAGPVIAELSSLRSAANRPRLLTTGERNGLPLGENLPGLRLAFPEAPGSSPAATQQRLFYFGALALALTVTLLGGYLLWRDVRRELHLAGLRSQFVSSVSHELRTPLTAIRLFAETLYRKRDADPRRQSEYLETILSESERLTRLVDNVLDFSRIEQGSKIYHLRPASLPEVVREAERAIAYPLAQLGFSLKVDADASIPAIRADADALQQAILNLLSNAMKYSGGSREIELRLRREGEHAVIQVTDHGAGIPVEQQRRIFERFYRVPTPENELVPGTGLGLTLVTHIVEAHGGAVQVRSAPGQGSTFSISLPLEMPS